MPAVLNCSSLAPAHLNCTAKNAVTLDDVLLHLECLRQAQTTENAVHSAEHATSYFLKIRKTILQRPYWYTVRHCPLDYLNNIFPIPASWLRKVEFVGGKAVWVGYIGHWATVEPYFKSVCVENLQRFPATPNEAQTARYHLAEGAKPPPQLLEKAQVSSW